MLPEREKDKKEIHKREAFLILKNKITCPKFNTPSKNSNSINAPLVHSAVSLQTSKDRP